MNFNDYFLTLSMFITAVSAPMAIAEEEEANKTPKKAAKQGVYVIETQVQGTQEQPNVIYITPWQENKTAVNVNKKTLQIALPVLEPITPKMFKKQLQNYHQQQVE